MIDVVGFEVGIPGSTRRKRPRPVAGSAHLPVALLVGDPPAVERIGSCRIVVGRKGAVAVLERGDAIVSASAVQRHRAIGALMSARKPADIAIRVQPAAGLRWEEQAGGRRSVVRAAKASHNDPLHIVVVVGAPGETRRQRLVDGVPDPGEDIGDLRTSRGAAGCHHVSDKDCVAAVVGFSQIVLKRGTARAVADDPALLVVIGVAQGVHRIVDNALPAGTGGVVEGSIPGVPLHEKYVSVGGYRTAAPVLVLVGGENSKLLVAGVRSSVDHQDVMGDLSKGRGR